MKKILREYLKHSNESVIQRANEENRADIRRQAEAYLDLLKYVDELEDALENVLIFKDDHASHQHAKDLLEKNK